ncbi:MAG TPA: hypothetical protein VFL55_12140 [Acetobacteraceae bacterium]|nr:hypothetical protein [Acetobacteraceae bacterium]
MNGSNSAEQLDLSLLLPRSTFWQIVHDLQSSLPPPADDTPEARLHRDRAAIADVASMLPANADEARIATRSVLADAQATECLRLARVYADDLSAVLKLNAQSVSMMRQANAARSLLARLQAARRKREVSNDACTQDAWTERAAMGLMADAMGEAMQSPSPADAELGVVTSPQQAGDWRGGAAGVAAPLGTAVTGTGDQPSAAGHQRAG